jgi:hypothetical protein
MRILSVALILTAAWAVPARAQWATSRVEHDWKITIGGQEFGLTQLAVYVTSLEHVNHRETTLHMGPYFAKTTRFRAPEILAAILSIPAAGIGLGLLLWGRMRPREGA